MTFSTKPPCATSIYSGPSRTDLPGRGARGRQQRYRLYDTVAEHRNGAVLAHSDHRGQRVVVTVTTSRGVAGATECFDGRFGCLAGYKSHAEPAQHPLGVEDGSPVHLG